MLPLTVIYLGLGLSLFSSSRRSRSTLIQLLMEGLYQMPLLLAIIHLRFGYTADLYHCFTLGNTLTYSIFNYVLPFRFLQIFIFDRATSYTIILIHLPLFLLPFQKKTVFYVNLINFTITSTPEAAVAVHLFNQVS